MLKTDGQLFISVPNPDKNQTLVPGKIVALDGTSVTAAFEQVISVSAAAADVTLYADLRGKFHQQAARFVSAEVAGEQTPARFTFETIGDPVSAEQRGAFRISTIAMRIPVKLGQIAGCVLADVSPEGLGITCPKALVVGSMVQISLTLDTFRIEGNFKVQSGKPTPGGVMRFGLYFPEKRAETRRTLERLTGYLQRMQLKRLSGAA